MGADINIRVYKYNTKTNLYNEIKIYRRRKPSEIFKYYDEEGNGVPFDDDYRPIEIGAGRNYEMFDGMKNGSEADGYGIFPMCPIALNSFAPKEKADLEKQMKVSGCYDFHEISLAEMKLYVIEHPTVVDYDSPEWEEITCDKPITKANPIKNLYDNIFEYIYIAEDYEMYEPLSHYKVVFYWDC